MDHVAPRFARRSPSPDLAPWIVCYWALSATDAPTFRSRVLPDGSNDLIVDLSGEPRSFVVGAMPRAQVVALEGRVELLGVRFRPGGALPFLHQPLNELTGREIELDALWGRAAGSLADALATDPGRRIEQLEHALRGARRQRWEESLVTRAVDWYHRSQGRVPVQQVAAGLGVGERRLERAFARCVGLSPKRLARVIRFLRTVRHIGRRPQWAGAPLALETGYADQSHFIREFKALAGVTPTEFAAERRSGIVLDDGAAQM